MTKSNDMFTSVSAITNAEGCYRRWWFEKKVKLPKDQGKATIFGDVCHAVIERFLRADDRGLDKNGKPVELYPADWMTMEDRWSAEKTEYTISDTEAALIKTLVHEAIVQGVLVREPGRIIEKEITQEIYSVGYAKVILKGFVDLELPNAIVDHKTNKNTKYALSKNKLKKSIQMNGYAYAKYLEGHKGNLWLTHNNLIKDFDRPQVIQRSVEVTQIEVFDFFNSRMLPIVRKMMEYHIKYPNTLLHKWRDIRPADNPNQDCNFHYGKPCPYIGICSGTCTIDNYLLKYGLTINKLIGNVEQKTKGIKMELKSLVDTISKEQKTIGAAPVVVAPVVAPLAGIQERMMTATPMVLAPTHELPVAAPTTFEVPTPLTMASPPSTAFLVVTPDTAPAPAPVAVPEKQVAPWYTPMKGSECMVCRDSKVLGYNYKMEPCSVCNIRAAEEGNPPASAYAVTSDATGVLTFTLKGTNQQTTVAVVAHPETKVQAAPIDAAVIAPIEALVAQRPLSPITSPTPSQRGADMIDKILSPDAPTIKALTDPLVLTRMAEETERVEKSMEVQKGKLITALGITEDMLGELEPKKEKGFTLMVGCSVVKGSQGIISADELLKDCLDVIKVATKKELSSIPHFELMQAIDSQVPYVLDTLVGSILVESVAPSRGSSLERLIDGLRPHADTVVYPLAN